MNSVKDWLRAVISLAILSLFATAYILHPDNALLVGALISMATLAAQFWLGSTATEHSNAETAGDTVKAFNAALNASPSIESRAAADQVADAARDEASKV